VRRAPLFAARSPSGVRGGELVEIDGDELLAARPGGQQDVHDRPVAQRTGVAVQLAGGRTAAARSVDIASEPAQIDADGYRPLRVSAAADAGSIGRRRGPHWPFHTAM